MSATKEVVAIPTASFPEGIHGGEGNLYVEIVLQLLVVRSEASG
jgi:hypothetical protein